MTKTTMIRGIYEGPTDAPDGTFDKQDTMYAWKIRLTWGRRRTSFWYFTNMASDDPEPRMEDTVTCFVRDAASGDSSFRDFCSEFGYSEDSRQTERTWKACVELRRKAMQFFGDDFDWFESMDEDDIKKQCAGWRDA